MAFALGPAAAAAGYRLLSFDTIGSTNAEARDRVAAGERGPVWIVAHRQTAGYGRRGRSWHTPEGNLAASLLLTVDVAPALAATLGFAAAVALHGALADVAPALDARVALDGADFGDDAGKRGRLQLKWPNDVLADGAKLAGIMLESVEAADGLRMVVGIGVNVTAAPSGLPYPATSLAALGAATTAENLFTALTDRWVAAVQRWDSARGLPDIREAWLARAAGIGAPVAVQSGERITRGIFETIDEDGRLILRQNDGRTMRVSAGEVHFGVAASAPAS